MRRQMVLLFTALAMASVGQRLSAQSCTLPENVTNHVGIFDQKPSLDIGPAPFLSGEAAHIGYNRVDTKEIWYALKEFGGQPPTWIFFKSRSERRQMPRTARIGRLH